MTDAKEHKVITLEGALGVRNASDVCQQLLSAFRESKSITVDTLALQEIDISILQLLVAARKEAVSQGGELLLKTEPGGVLEKALIEIGLLDPDGASRNEDDHFWHGRIQEEEVA